MPMPLDDSRTAAEVTQHYIVECELAAILRDAPSEARRRLYADVYNELFRRVPTHPQLTRKCSAEDTGVIVEQQMKLMRRFLTPTATYLEIGSGDCAFAFEVAKLVGKVYAVDVSIEVTGDVAVPDNGELVLSDGCSIPVPEASVSVAYSNQLMEHLHPDDAVEQLQNLLRALAPGGRYVCITPNRLNGPHDVSKYFDREARGFHLREYTTAELRRLFTEVGFSHSVTYARALGMYFPVPGVMVTSVEALLNTLPVRLRGWLARRIPLRWLLGINLVGVK